MVDLLIAADHLLGAHLDRCSDVLELEVVEPVAVVVAEKEPAVIEDAVVIKDAYSVLSVAGVGRPLDSHGLVGVVARTRDLKGLVDITTVGFLLDLVRNGAVVVLRSSRSSAMAGEAANISTVSDNIAANNIVLLLLLTSYVSLATHGGSLLP